MCMWYIEGQDKSEDVPIMFNPQAIKWLHANRLPQQEACYLGQLSLRIYTQGGMERALSRPIVITS